MCVYAYVYEKTKSLLYAKNVITFENDQSQRASQLIINSLVIINLSAEKFADYFGKRKRLVRRVRRPTKKIIYLESRREGTSARKQTRALKETFN